MEKSASIKNIATALLKFHTIIGKIPKDSNNPFFKSSYAALPDILDKVDPALIESNLVLTQWPTGLHGLTTLLVHTESGEYMQETYEMTPVKNDPQSLGSSITYQRRYALGAVLSLNIDIDDDANKATGLAEGSNTQPSTPTEAELPWLNKKDTEAWDKVVTALKAGTHTITDVRKKYKVSKATEAELNEAIR